MRGWQPARRRCAASTFIERGRRIAGQRVERAVAHVAATAGIDHVTPHQLRHTLATQAINRGMSLEAIAALLGHRSMRMTMVYAKIANRTVADEYFTVSEKVEALYNQPKQLPADAERSEMLKLRREMHRRMLGNGYCARPIGLDCHRRGRAQDAPARHARWGRRLRPKVDREGSYFEWAYLHQGASGPGPDHPHRLVEVGDLDLGIATDHLLGLRQTGRR